MINLSKIILIVLITSVKSFNLTQSLELLRLNRSLMGLALKITNNSNLIYSHNSGLRDNISPVQNETMFKMASLSKSFAAVGIMKLVQEKKLTLNQSITDLIGFKVFNPNYPTKLITLQMVMSHRSTINDCQPYYTQFMKASFYSVDGYSIPNISQILMPGGKFYSSCIYSDNNEPGQYFSYVNLNYGVVGTIIERISGMRFDEYMRENILKHISYSEKEVATFNIETITNISHLGVQFIGNDGKWEPRYDYYPDGKINKKNLTGYVIGKNGNVFSPQAGLRATVGHLTNYMLMLANKGVTIKGVRILTQTSVKQLHKPRYQYHGSVGGSIQDLHVYGLGLFRTTYRKTDQIISHKVVIGHLGEDYGLISGYFFWDNYTLSYAINGALNGYQNQTSTLYEGERLWIHQAVQKYLAEESIQANIQFSYQ